jgi:site-specific recombinase XerD
MNSERQKRYRQNNLPRIQVKQNIYYVENCERIKAQQKAYRDANRRLLVIRYYFRYYGKKGWSKEDIKKIIKQKLNINAEDYEINKEIDGKILQSAIQTKSMV